MTTANLRVAGKDWERLREHFYRASFRRPNLPETGAIGVVGMSRAGGRQEYLVSSIMLPESGDLALTTGGAVTFSPGYLRRAHLKMRKEKLAGLVLLHTHPLAGNSVGFSGYDDEQEPGLVRNLMEIEPATNFLSIVVGRESQCGRVWQNPARPIPMDELITIGESIRLYNLGGQPNPAPAKPAAIFDRAMSLTGVGALHLLSRLKFAVVGASGTGSLICELLARAGAQNILVIDDDITKIVNLNRILHATRRDAKRRRAKVDLLKHAIESIGIGCNVRAVKGTILDHDTLKLLQEVDVIFGCVDAAIPRLFLSQFALQYLRPVIDVGTEIGGDDCGIASLDARVSYLAPGRPCLQCTGVVTARRLRFEGLSAAEREREAKLGYSDDLLLAQPAVMDLNMRAASLGMLLMRHLLQPFLLTPLPIALQEGLLTFSMKTPSTAKSANPLCPTCRVESHLGFGDRGPVLGYDQATVDLITGRCKPKPKNGIVKFLDGLRRRPAS